MTPLPPCRTAAVLVTATVATVLTAAAAAGHVTVQPQTAEQGGFAALSFRVPTERDDASTTMLEVTFPTEQPLRFVSVKPHPGWSYEVTRATLPEPVNVRGTEITETVSTITWTADNAAAGIKPGEYDEFSVSVGFLPEADQMVFKAIQTYDSGEVVSWIEEAATGAEEPEFPAPVLTLTAPHDEKESDATSASDAGGATATESHDGSSSVGTWLGGTALVVALLATAMAGLALRGRNRPANDQP